MSRPNRNNRETTGSEPAHQSPSNFSLLIGLFRKHFLLLLVPVALFSASAAAYTLTRKPVWRATQTLQIRDELAMQTVMPGRFNSLDMMKMVQETIHETVRRHSVVEKVLRSINPPAGYESPQAWPSVEDVENMQGSISLSPPNGAEFGRTEILLLSVKAETTDRAKKIVALLAQELQFQLNELRDKRAASIENELDESVRLATSDLDSSNQELAEFEKGIGDILVDLRSVSSDTGSSGTTLHSRLNNIFAEQRDAAKRRDVLDKQIDIIREAANDPDQVLTFSSELLDAQPSLKKLKDELITIQSNTAMKLGQFESFHPKAKAAIEAENVVKEKILDEVKIAVQGLKGQVDVVTKNIDRLETIEKKLRGKLQKLAESRAKYSALLKNVEQRRTVVNKALEDLARAKASRAAARTTSLVTSLDEPFSGSRPEGMSKKIVVGAAGFAGLVSGIGLVFFAASPSFVGPMGRSTNKSDDSVTLPEWKTEALGTGTQNTSGDPGRDGSSRQRTDDLVIHKVDFREDENILNDEVDYEEIFGEPSGAKTSPARGNSQESFQLEPRKKNSRTPDDKSQQTKSVTDSTSGDTQRSEIYRAEDTRKPAVENDEATLRELHRRQIDEMLRED